MGDLVMRISTFVQRGFICQRCGIEIDGELTGEPRTCQCCEELDAANRREEQAGQNPPERRRLAARP
ncbi:MAG: hypothetical protein JNL58_18900 [Planctomyces sp.]|nr:hypothetical protein [Planctomyces sp.]